MHEIFQRVRENFPGAVVRASTFDEYSRKLVEAAPDLDLPVFTGEIGDTWIGGVASDPAKLSRFRDLLRLRRSLMGSFANDYALKNFSRMLLKVRWECADDFGWRTHKSQSMRMHWRQPVGDHVQFCRY